MSALPHPIPAPHHPAAPALPALRLTPEPPTPDASDVRRALESLLSDYLNPALTLAAIARRHNLSVPNLLDLLSACEALQARLIAHNHHNALRARILATAQLPLAVQSLSTICPPHTSSSPPTAHSPLPTASPSSPTAHSPLPTASPSPSTNTLLRLANFHPRALNFHPPRTPTCAAPPKPRAHTTSPLRAAPQQPTQSPSPSPPAPQAPSPAAPSTPTSTLRPPTFPTAHSPKSPRPPRHHHRQTTLLPPSPLAPSHPTSDIHHPTFLPFPDSS